jgi:hypothetical protein
MLVNCERVAHFYAPCLLLERFIAGTKPKCPGSHQAAALIKLD